MSLDLILHYVAPLAWVQKILEVRRVDLMTGGEVFVFGVFEMIWGGSQSPGQITMEAVTVRKQ